MQELNKLIILTGLISSSDTVSDACLTELNWCIYDLQTKEYKSESTNIIKTDINSLETSLEIHLPIFTVLGSFSDFIKKETSNCKSALIINSSLVRQKCIEEFDKLGLSLPPIFSSCIDLIDQFKKFYKVNSELLNVPSDQVLNKILQYFNLKPSNSIRFSINELNSMTRIVNKLVKDGCVFSVSSPPPSTCVEKSAQSKDKEEITLCLPNQFEQYYFTQKEYYLKIKGVPNSFLKFQMKNLVSSYNVSSDVSYVD